MLKGKDVELKDLNKMNESLEEKCQNLLLQLEKQQTYININEEEQKSDTLLMRQPISSP